MSFCEILTRFNLLDSTCVLIVKGLYAKLQSPFNGYLSLVGFAL